MLKIDLSYLSHAISSNFHLKVGEFNKCIFFEPLLYSFTQNTEYMNLYE